MTKRKMVLALLATAAIAAISFWLCGPKEIVSSATVLTIETGQADCHFAWVAYPRIGTIEFKNGVAGHESVDDELLVAVQLPEGLSVFGIPLESAIGHGLIFQTDQGDVPLWFCRSLFGVGVYAPPESVLNAH